MSFNGSGVFNVNSAGQPVVASTLITSAAFNAFTADVATALSTCILKDGQQTVTANIPFGGNKLTGVAAGTARTDAANIGLLQDGTGVYVATVGGTVDVITLTPSPAITAYVAGQSFKFIAAGANTTNVTVNISGLGAKAVTKTGSTPLVGGDLPSGAIVHATYDGTRFQVQVGQATINASTLISNLVSYVHPDVNTAHRDTIKAGFVPAWFNQQWGGGVNGYELVDAATGTPYKFESATGYVEQNTAAPVGSGVGTVYNSQGFKVSTSFTPTEVWIKGYKVGNPTGNITAQIWSDNAGSPNAALGSSGTLSLKLVESGDTSGAWYRITLAGPALTAGTQYHLVLSVAQDASNYFAWNDVTPKKYPHGFLNQGTAVPAWTQYSTYAGCFFIPHISTTATFQSGGMFGDGKAVFYEGSPLNQSNQRRADLADLKGLIPNNMTLLLRGTAHTKDKTIADMTYGLDHDRVVVRCNVTTGYPSVTVYDSAGTASTVTGTTDISSGDHDVAVLVTTAGCSLWIDGASQGTPIVTTITFDTLFAQGQVGSLWIGGGFALAPTWSGSSISTFSGLPSTLGWAYAGIATEGSAFSVSGGKLYQNKSGYTALQDGYYKKTTAGLSNANGWNLATKERTVSATNTKDVLCPWVGVYDGSKVCNSQLSEYYMEGSSAAYQYAQLDLKTADNVLHKIGKGSDFYSFVNGRLTIDGTGKCDSATATNEIYFGDGSTASGESSDVVWSYMKYYTTAARLPQATAGSLSEWAIWTGDKTSILATLWNSGSPISVKQFCGLGVNWKRGDDGAWVSKLHQRGITSNPTSTSMSLLPELEGFVIGDQLDVLWQSSLYNGTGGAGILASVKIDGAYDPSTASNSSLGYDVLVAAPGATYQSDVVVPRTAKTYFGPHKVEGIFGAASGTTTSQTFIRRLTAEGRS